MALNTDTTIRIGETVIRNFSQLHINQEIHKHHTFSVEVRQDILVKEYESVMAVTQKLTSQKISIEIKPIPDLDDLMIITNPKDYMMQFYGVVNKVRMRKSRSKDMEETILLQGYSTSIVLDNGPESNSFTKMPLGDIVNKVKSGYDIDMNVRPYYNDILAYTVQYNESDFDFLNRIAKRHGQWFYDNGRNLIFGTPGGESTTPALVYGVNMHEFSYDIKLAPTLFKTIENDNRKGDYSADATARYGKEADGLHQNFINKSNQVFNKETVIQLNQNAVGGDGKSTAEEYTKNKMRAALSGMMKIEASSEVPGVTLGGIVTIKGVDKQLESTYRVTQITHTCDDGGGYENHFTAVNFNGAVFSPKTNPDLIPRCESQYAIVMDNNDPDKLSGITLQMPWQEAKGETTPFIPMVQTHGGDGKGFHWIPEIGETVLVDFQGGNAEMPFVVGTMANRKEKSGYSTPKNDLKVMRTRSGIIIVFNDAEGSLLIEDPSGNKYFMDGKGNIFVTAPKNIEFKAGEDIIINAGKNINTTATMNSTENIGVNKSTTVGMLHSTSIGGNSILDVKGNFSENIEGNLESHTEQERKEVSLKGYLLDISDNVHVKSANDLQVEIGG